MDTMRHYKQATTLPQYQPDYSFDLAWELSFNYPKSVKMFNDNYHVPYILGIVFYLTTIYVGKFLMQNREPFRLKLPLVLWNSCLAIFSIVGFARVLPEMIHSLRNYGFYHSVCNNSYVHVSPARFWIYLFVLSKTPELGDTFFLVLRKQKLIFLHVYHHASVLIFSWFVYSNELASSRWFCTMNFGVHSIMYTYYVLKAFPNILRIPKGVSMLITSLQTIQMVAGAIVVSTAFYHKLIGNPCASTTTMSVAGLFIYISYLFLFSRFFYNAYLRPRPDKHEVTEKKQS